MTEEMRTRREAAEKEVFNESTSPKLKAEILEGYAMAIRQGSADCIIVRWVREAFQGGDGKNRPGPRSVLWAEFSDPRCEPMHDDERVLRACPHWPAGDGEPKTADMREALADIERLTAERDCLRAIIDQTDHAAEKLNGLLSLRRVGLTSAKDIIEAATEELQELNNIPYRGSPWDPLKETRAQWIERILRGDEVKRP